FVALNTGLVRAASARLDASFGRQDHTTLPSAHVLAGSSTAGVCSPSKPCENAVSAVSSARKPLLTEHPLGDSRPATPFAPDAVASIAPQPAVRDDRDPPLFRRARVFRLYDKSEFR